MNMNNSPDELIPRSQAARLLREMFPEADASAITNACWLAFRDCREDCREECARAELLAALKHYMPEKRRDFRLK